MAQARVASDGGGVMDIQLFLQDGTVIKVTEEGGRGPIGGQQDIIDAEFKDLTPPSSKK